MNKKFKYIGKPVIRQDAYEKVTGKAKFGDDYSFPGMLYGVMVRTEASHAIIKSIDYSALTSTKVKICDSNDIIGTKKVGALTKDQPIFCYDKIRNPADVVCMLVGENENELRSVQDKVKVELEELSVLTDAEKALKDDAPLIHPDLGSNQIVHYPLRKGNVEEGFKKSEHIIEQRYTTPHVEHAYIEPEVIIAVPLEGKKGVQVIGSIQNPYTCRRVVAGVLDLPLTKVRIIQAEMGGSFGGKDDTVNVIAARAAVAAIKCGKPIKIKYSREDSIRESYKRHPYFMNYKVGFNNDGKLLAMKIDITADGGTYASLSPFVTWRTVVQASGPYEIENVHTDVRAVYTNNSYTGAFRGFGSPQPIFAQESIMDEIAEKVGKTPIEIRQLNGFKEGSETASGQILGQHDVNLMTVMEQAVKHSDFELKWNENKSSNVPAFQIDESTNLNFILEHADLNSPESMKRRGIGLATSFRGCALGAEGIDAAASYMSIQQDGSIYLLSGLAENGQGLRTTFSLIAAEILGISPEHIYYLEMDTGIVPDSGPTVASRSTLMGGGATKNAAEILKSRLEQFLVSYWNTSNKGELLFTNDEVIWSEDESKRMNFADLCNSAYWKGVSLATIGWYEGPKVDWNEETGQGAAYFTYVYGCQVAEVEVDLSTGEVYIERIVAVHDPGKVINLLGAQGQVYGGVTQGAGFGLWEEVNSYDGKIKEDNFDQYLIPTSQDIGKIEAHFVEGKDVYGAWGAKSLGEPTLELTAAAIANAVKNATGIRFHNLPLNLEEILLNRKLKPTDLKRGSTN